MGIALAVSAVWLMPLVAGAGAEEGTWTNLKPASSPRPMDSHAMAYDAESDRTILFGGWEGPSPLLFVPGDTWAYDFTTNTWTLMSPPTSPVTRVSHAMAYDAESDRIVLFGGQYGGGIAGDTWAYDFNTNTWTDMNPASSPPPRLVGSMAYDTESDRIILFGGLGGVFGGVGEFVTLGDTWAYDFNTNTWANMNPASGPTARKQHSLAYDIESDRIVLYGGFRVSFAVNNDTWAFDFNTNTWTNMTPPRSPPPRVAHAMAYDAVSDRVLLFGGATNFSVFDNRTWFYSFNENAWLELHPALSPPRRVEHAMAYDAGSNRIILFGGRSGFIPRLTETWAYHSRAPPSFVPLFLLPVILAATAVSALVVVLFWRRRAKARDFRGKGHVRNPRSVPGL